MAKRFSLWLIFSAIILGLLFIFSLSWGEIKFWPWHWPKLDADGMEWAIITQIRLPRTLTALSIGGMLAMSGCLLQGLFKNPLVEPYTLGISGGASLGVALAFVCGLSGGLFPAVGVFAFIGAFSVSLLLLFYSRYCHSIGSLLLVGLITGILCSSVTTLLMSLASPQDMARIITWTMGSVENTDNRQSLILCGFALFGLIACIMLSQRVNLMAAGSRTARLMGVNTALLVPVLLCIAALLTAVSVSYAGIIGFAGLVVPHILRRIASSDYRLLLPLSFMVGGTFLLFCDLIARSIIAPSQLPIGVVSGIIGGSVFIYVLLKKPTNA